MTQSTGLNLNAMMIGVMMIFLLVIFAVCILAIIAEWKLFKKAGQPGWAAVIPFYNGYVLTKITWGNGWMFLLAFLPIGNIVFLVLTCIKLAHAFGKGAGFAVGLILLPYIFLLILAFDSSLYQGPDQGNNKGPVIACVIVGIVGVLLFIVFGAVATMKIAHMRERSVYLQDESEEEDVYGEDVYGDDENEYDTDGSEDIASVEKAPIEGSEYFVSAILDDGEGQQVSVPVLDDEYMSVIGTGAYSSAEGITTSVYMGYVYGDASEMVSDAVSTQRETLESMSDYYSDITVDEMITGDGYALQQINYNYKTWDDKQVPCFEIIKCDLQGDNAIMLDLTVDNSAATGETQAAFEEACKLYGIDFQFD